MHTLAGIDRGPARRSTLADMPGTAVGPAPPARLTRRAAEVTHALIKTRGRRPSRRVTAAHAHRWSAPAVTVGNTLAALLQAREAGMACGPPSSPTRRAREFLGQLEDWLYAP